MVPENLSFSRLSALMIVEDSGNCSNGYGCTLSLDRFTLPTTPAAKQKANTGNRILKTRENTTVSAREIRLENERRLWMEELSACRKAQLSDGSHQSTKINTTAMLKLITEASRIWPSPPTKARLVKPMIDVNAVKVRGIWR